MGRRTFRSSLTLGSNVNETHSQNFGVTEGIFSVSRILSEIDTHISNGDGMEIENIEKEVSKTDEVSKRKSRSAPENVQIIEEIVIDEEVDLVIVEEITVDDTEDSITVEEITVEDNDELPNIQIEDVDFSTSDIEDIEIIPQASTSRPAVPKCYLCNTCFKDMDFLKKHIQKKHPSNNSLLPLSIAQEMLNLSNQNVHTTQTNLPRHTNTVHGYKKVHAKQARAETRS